MMGSARPNHFFSNRSCYNRNRSGVDWMTAGWALTAAAIRAVWTLGERKVRAPWDAVMGNTHRP